MNRKSPTQQRSSGEQAFQAESCMCKDKGVYDIGGAVRIFMWLCRIYSLGNGMEVTKDEAK